MIVHSAAAQGADAQAICRATGFDPNLASDPDARIPIELEEALFDAAARACRDEAFGLHAAELVQPGAFDVLDYAVRTAPTLRVALDRLVRYNCIVHSAAEFKVVLDQDKLRIEHAFRVSDVVQCRHSAEFTIAATLVFARQMTEVPIAPLRIEFRHGRPASEYALSEQRRLFGMDAHFSSHVNALELPRSVLELPVPKADPRLSRLMERHAEALREALPDPSLSTTERVRRLVSSTLGQGEATLASVAERLKMSERTLQRKLADEGHTFDALLDSVRRELALRYLADPKLAVAEVAYLLGYSEPSPFHRAFKRWTGVTPAEARKRAS